MDSGTLKNPLDMTDPFLLDLFDTLFFKLLNMVLSFFKPFKNSADKVSLFFYFCSFAVSYLFLFSSDKLFLFFLDDLFLFISLFFVSLRSSSFSSFIEESGEKIFLSSFYTSFSVVALIIFVPPVFLLELTTGDSIF